VFVWLFHRISGALLIGLLSVQLITGFFQASSSNADLVKTIASLHRHAVMNGVLVFCVIFHGLYGIRTIVLDFGVKRERLLFWVCTALGAILFAVFLFCYFSYVTV
jgi:succinate dehydrogenase/fumarate reductase cytochrome b subunit